MIISYKQNLLKFYMLLISLTYFDWHIENAVNKSL